MQDEHEHAIVVKKSSVEIDESAEILTEPEGGLGPRPVQSSIGQQLQDVESGNLLDLQMHMEELSLQEHLKFLEDRVVSIQGPELITENVIKSYKLYKVKSRKKDMETYDTCVSRRFSDFEYLQHKLIENYGGCIIPLLPQKNFWANINMEGETYISERTRQLEKYLRNLLAHKTLRLAPELKSFLFFDEDKFSKGKGEFFSNIKTEDMVKSIASNALTFGKGIIDHYFYGKDPVEEGEQHVVNPNLEDFKFIEYQRDVEGLVKVLKILRNLVENSLTEMRVVEEICQIDHPDHDRPSNSATQGIKLQQQFEELSHYILSCKEALNRRNAVRVEIDTLEKELESLQKKAKVNPRSQKIDIVRNKLAKATQRCQKWTASLRQQLESSVQVGKSMVEFFINNYTDEKQKFYDS